MVENIDYNISLNITAVCRTILGAGERVQLTECYTHPAELNSGHNACAAEYLFTNWASPTEFSLGY